ncbi:MAG TPA: EI24 domain-containing protein [Planctomycetota bacterium]
MTTTTSHRCPCCGYLDDDQPCRRCPGIARPLHGGPARPAGRGLGLADVYRGLRDVHQAVFSLLHGKEFIGLLRWPIAANAIAFAALVLVGWLVIAPWFTTLCGGTWWLFDGLRTSHGSSTADLWLLSTWLLLGPPLLDVLTGSVHEPIRAATELRMLGPANRPGAREGLLRLRDRVRILAFAALALPVVLLVSLLPWVGLPIVLVLGAACAAIVWFEPPMAARGHPLRARLQLLWQNRWRALGTGAGMQLAAAVPFVNLLALAGVATVAATASFLQFEKRPAA